MPKEKDSASPKDTQSKRNDGEKDVAANPVPGPAAPGVPQVGPSPELAAQEAENLKAETANAARNAALAAGARLPDSVEEVHRAAPDVVPPTAPKTAAPSANPPRTGRGGGPTKV